MKRFEGFSTCARVVAFPLLAAMVLGAGPSHVLGGTEGPAGQMPRPDATVLPGFEDENWDGRFVLPDGVENSAGSAPSPVQACVVDGRGRVYVGGAFTAAGGVLANRVAMWDGTRWSALGSGFKCGIRALAVDAAGNLYAGMWASVPCPSAVMKWDGAGWTELQGLSLSARVNALAVGADGTLYAAGTDMDPVTYEYFGLLVRWNGTGWSEVGPRIKAVSIVDTPEINAIALHDNGDVLVGGRFRNAGGVAVQNIARWDGTTWVGLGAGVRGTVNALVLDGAGQLYAGGTFEEAGGLPAGRVARWDGTNWSALGSGLSFYVQALATDDSGDLYAGGRFASAGGVSALRVARWDGTAWSSLGPGMDDRVDALAMDRNGHLWAAGGFEVAGGVTANHVARWDGSTWWAPGSGTGLGLGSPVYALAADTAGTVYVGGGFAAASGQVVNRIAKWDGKGWSPLGSGLELGGIPPSVWCLLADGEGSLFAGGDFTTAGGVVTNNVARWDGVGWSALGSGMPGIDDQVLALARDGAGVLYAGGKFAVAGGVSAANVAQWNGTGWSALGSGTNGGVLALTVDGAGHLFAGGGFTQAGGISANHVAKWDGTSWSPVGAGLDGQVNALTMDQAGNLYAAVSFSAAGTAVARWDGVSWSDLGSGFYSADALAVDRQGNLYASGVAGRDDARVSRWDGTRWSSLGSEMNHPAKSLHLDRYGNVYAAGLFTSVGGKMSSHFALRRERRTIVATAGPGGTIVPSGEVTVMNGESQSFAIDPEVGYHVADVLVDGVSMGAVARHTIAGVTADHSIAASFAVNTYSLAVRVLGGGSVTRSPDSPRYDHGTQVLLTAIPEPGWTFAGWSGDVGGHNHAVSLRMDSEKAVTATFCGVAALSFEPRVLNPRSEGEWVTGHVRPPSPYRASQIDVGSLRLNGVVPVSSKHPAKVVEHGTRLEVKFARAELIPTLIPGDRVPVTVSGKVGGVCFAGADEITVLAPPPQPGVGDDDRGRVAVRPPAPGDGSANGGSSEESGLAPLGLRPLSPAAGSLAVRFSLAGHAPAALVAYDVGGRCIVTRDIGFFGPGWHEIDLGGLPAGVYVLRLTQAGRHLTARAVVVR